MNLSTLIRYGLLGAMGAGASALVPDAEAEAAMLPGARKELLNIIARKGVTRKPDGRVLLAEPKRPSVEVGYLEPEVWKQAEKLFPGISNIVYTNAHILGKRWNRYKQKPIETLDQLKTTLDDGTGKIVPNFSKDADSAPYGIWTKDEYGDVFAPLSIRNGALYVNTVMRPNPSQLKELRGGGGRVSSSPGYVGLIPEASLLTTSGAQLSPFSAVTPQSGGTVQQSYDDVNMYKRDAIEADPLIDPINLITGLAGAGKGVLSKLGSVAMEYVPAGILEMFGRNEG